MAAKSTPRVLLIGSGIHRQFGAPRESPAADWRALLIELAKVSGLRRWEPPTSGFSDAWESLVLAVMSMPPKPEVRKRVKSKEPIAAHEVEGNLRRRAGEVLEKSREYGHFSVGGQQVLDAIRRMAKAGPLHIIDFNYDMTLASALGVETMPEVPSTLIRVKRGRVGSGAVLRSSDVESLYTRAEACGAGEIYIWKPHGHLGKPKTIRMGLRDYGLMPAVIDYAYSHLKQVEREWSGGSSMSHQRLCQAKLTALTRAKSRHRADTWVAHAITFECFAIGMGLSEHEWGLRWLLAQRRRNYARRGKEPKFTHLMAREESNMLGVRSRVFQSWNTAWKRLGT